jgi:predicted aminopeptidase
MNHGREDRSMKAIVKLLFMPVILILCSFAYAAPGSLLWEDYYDREGVARDVANAIAVQGNSVFVAGVTDTGSGGGAFTVRAYSVK